MLKDVLDPSHIVEFEGCVIIEGALLTVSRAELDVAAGLHVPVTTHRY